MPEQRGYPHRIPRLIPVPVTLRLRRSRSDKGEITAWTSQSANRNRFGHGQTVAGPALCRFHPRCGDRRPIRVDRKGTGQPFGVIKPDIEPEGCVTGAAGAYRASVDSDGESFPFLSSCSLRSKVASVPMLGPRLSRPKRFLSPGDVVVGTGGALPLPGVGNGIYPSPRASRHTAKACQNAFDLLDREGRGYVLTIFGPIHYPWHDPGL